MLIASLVLFLMCHLPFILFARKERKPSLKLLALSCGTVLYGVFYLAGFIILVIENPDPRSLSLLWENIALVFALFWMIVTLYTVLKVRSVIVIAEQEQSERELKSRLKAELSAMQGGGKGGEIGRFFEGDQEDRPVAGE